MSKFQHDVMLKFVKVIDLIMITIPFALCWELYYSYQVYAKFGWRGNWTMLGLFAVLFFLLGKVYDAFWMSLQRISELIYGQVLAAMATDGILYIVICLMSRRLCNILPGIAAIAGQVVMATLWAKCAHSWYFRTFPPQPTAVVYDVRHGLEKLINEYGLSKKYDVKMTLNVEECLNDLSLLDDMQSVFISGVHSHERNIILKYCVGQGINVFVIPRVGDVIMSGSQPMHMFHLPVLRVGRYMASPEYLFVKRLMDIVVSLVGLVILSPLFLITAIAVKSDGGPAFYKQVRLTKDGKQFEILKFRSMRTDADQRLKELGELNQYAAQPQEADSGKMVLGEEEMRRLLEDTQNGMLYADDFVIAEETHHHKVETEQENAFVKIENDPRITRLGHFLRKYSIDELPQLFNILRGDMSVVGNRPLPLYEAERLTSDEYIERFMCPSGLTGLWQVEKRGQAGKLSPEQRKQLDIEYARKMSPWFDLKIILRTFTAFIQKENV